MRARQHLWLCLLLAYARSYTPLHGQEILPLEDLSLEQQMAAFSTSTVLVGMHGSGLHGRM